MSTGQNSMPLINTNGVMNILAQEPNVKMMLIFGASKLEKFGPQPSIFPFMSDA